MGRKAKETTTDPALKSSLSELATVLQQVNEQSDTLTAAITEFEKSLVDMKPGFDVWVTPFNITNPNDYYSLGMQLGFSKVARTWGLYLRQGQFSRSVATPQWEPGDDLTYTRLVEASRDDRIAAVEHFEELVDKMKEAAAERLKALVDVNSDRCGGEPAAMPEHHVLRTLAGWIQDIAVFCGVVKPHLFAIAEFLLFIVGLVTVLGFVVRAH